MNTAELPWKTDKQGTVLGARVHDGRIIGLSFVDPDASLIVRRTDGGVVVFKLGGLADWNLAFFNGAIVSEVYVWKVDSVPDDSGAIPDSGWNVLYGSRYNPKDIKDQARKIKRELPESFLVQFACSYGGNIAAVCKHVSVFEGFS